MAEAKAAYEASGLCASVEYDQIITLDAIPSDPHYADGSLWGLHNTGQTVEGNAGTVDADIDAFEAWDMRTDASSVVVAVIDTGINYNHLDLNQNMWRNDNEQLNGMDDDNNGYIDDIYGIDAISGSGDPMDDNQHGTHCAGTIGAVGNNGIGVTGVCWNVQLMALKFLDGNGSGANSDAIECIEYALEHGADILSNSWGSQSEPSLAMIAAIEAARDAGVIFVAAAGNDTQNNDRLPSSPSNAAVDNVVSVAALDNNDELAYFSNYGINNVDIGAPGVSILSCAHDDITGYRFLNGTSMACPHVAGALALIKAEYPDDTYLELIQRLYVHVDMVPDLMTRCTTGGRLNLNRSIRNGLLPLPPDNDDFANARIFTGRSDIDSVRNETATFEVGEPEHVGAAGRHSVWWSWTAPESGNTLVSTLGSTFDTQAAVYTGSSVSSLTQVAANNDAGGVQTARVGFQATSGVTYHIAIDGFGTATGRVLVTLTMPPDNDDFVNAILLEGTDLWAIGTNDGASGEPGEPELFNTAMEQVSIWYKWTVPGPHQYLLTTFGSTLDTVVQAYQGPTVDDLDVVGYNEDKIDGDWLWSEVLIAGEGHNLMISIDGENRSTGDVQLTITDNSNDDFENATTLYPVIDAVDLATNAQCSRQTHPTDPLKGEPLLDEKAFEHTVWWKWTAPTSGQVTIDTAGSSFWPLLGVYLGNSPLELLEVTKSTPVRAGTTSVSFAATAGLTYNIVVDGYRPFDSETGSSYPPEVAQGLIVLNLSQDAGVAARTVTLSPAGLAKDESVTITDDLGRQETVVNDEDAVFHGRMASEDNTYDLSLPASTNN